MVVITIEDLEHIAKNRRRVPSVYLFDNQTVLMARIVVRFENGFHKWARLKAIIDMRRPWNRSILSRKLKKGWTICRIDRSWLIATHEVVVRVFRMKNNPTGHSVWMEIMLNKPAFSRSRGSIDNVINTRFKSLGAIGADNLSCHL